MFQSIYSFQILNTKKQAGETFINLLGAVHKRRPYKIVKNWPLPPCGHTINYENFEVFCTKKCGRPHLKNSSSIVRTG